MTSAPTSWVLHVDLDQFLAAVEVRRRPELAGKPIVVGGDGDPMRPRQVVATASYEARAFGVRSGMPLQTAARRCPDAVFLPSDRPVYEEASAEVMATLRFLPVVVEQLGWDEAFLGAETSEPVELAQELRARVLADTGLSCAVGIGQSRLQAKTATGFAKPGGIAMLTAATWLTTMGDKPVTALWGIGDRIARRLADAGIKTVAELARSDHHDLAARFGPTIGPNLRLMGMGGHTSPIVDEPHVARSRSKEVTYTRDLTDRSRVGHEVERLAREVTESVVAEGREVTHVAVKLRTRSFWTRNKIRKLSEPTTDPTVVAQLAQTLLAELDLGQPIRLLGVRVVLVFPPS